MALVFGYIFIAKRRLHQKGVLLTAKTTKWVYIAKGGMDLQYEFVYKDETISGNNAFKEFTGNRNFENRFFPVIYYPSLGGHSQLLLRPNDFKSFNLSFPDSLSWILSYLKD